MSKNVFVFGGFNGFLGKAIRRCAVSQGHKTNETPQQLFNGMQPIDVITYKHDKESDTLHLYGIGRKECNLLDKQQVQNFLECTDIKPDIVLYTAAKCGGVLDNQKDPFGFWFENTAMALNMLSAIQSQPIKSFVGVLSSCIYPADITGLHSNSEYPCEDYPMSVDDIYLGPVDYSNIGYATSKRALLDGMMSLSKTSDIAFNALVPCNMFGVGDSSSHFIPTLMKKIKTTPAGEEIVLHGTGEEIRQFMDVDDCASCILEYLSMTFNPFANSGLFEDECRVWIDNIAPAQSMTVREAAERIIAIVDPTRKIVFNEDESPQFRKDIASDLHYEWTDFDETIRKIMAEKAT